MFRAEVTDRCEDWVKFFQGQVRILPPQLGEAVSYLLVVNWIVLRIMPVKKFHDGFGFSVVQRILFAVVLQGFDIVLHRQHFPKSLDDVTLENGKLQVANVTKLQPRLSRLPCRFFRIHISLAPDVERTAIV